MAQALSTLLLLWFFLEVALHQAAHQRTSAVQQRWEGEMEGEMVSLMAQTLSTLLLVWPFLEVALHQAAHQ